MTNDIMPRMGKHREEAMTTRARVAGWSVFIIMAGTTMSFQVYHSVKHGLMPWPLAYLYGIVPLLLSMLVIEFVSSWKSAPKWARPSAYLIIGGSMYLSAAATGAVVLHAAPIHSSLLFGLLLDGAAILAARFLMAGTHRAAAEHEAAQQAALDAERAARLQAELDRDTAVSEKAALADEGEQERAALQAQLEVALQRNSEAPKPPRRPITPKPRAKGGDEQSDEQKLGTEAAALSIIEQEPDISGSELGRRLGVQPGYGRTLKRRLAPALPGGDS